MPRLRTVDGDVHDRQAVRHRRRTHGSRALTEAAPSGTTVPPRMINHSDDVRAAVLTANNFSYLGVSRPRSLPRPRRSGRGCGVGLNRAPPAGPGS